MNIKIGIDYFSFDIDFFQDEKIQFVSARFGTKGEAITIRLLCKIYRNGYYTKWDGDTALLFAKSVGDNCSDSCVNDVVHELVKREFFDKGIFDRFGILTSRGIQKRYFEAGKRRKIIDINGDLLLVNPSDYQNVNVLNQNVNILGENADNQGQNVPESKGKERESKGKRKESKPAPEKTQFAEFVNMTNDEYLKLVTKFGEYGAKRMIEILDNAKGAKGYKYKSDYRAILNWVVSRYQEEQDNGKASPQKQSNPFFDAAQRMEDEDG
jgi:hypothetical protein